MHDTKVEAGLSGTWAPSHIKTVSSWYGEWKPLIWGLPLCLPPLSILIRMRLLIRKSNLPVSIARAEGRQEEAFSCIYVIEVTKLVDKVNKILNGKCHLYFELGSRSLPTCSLDVGGQRCLHILRGTRTSLPDDVTCFPLRGHLHCRSGYTRGN